MTYFKFVVESGDGDTYFSAVRGTSESSARRYYEEHHPGATIISVTKIGRDEYRLAIQGPKRDTSRR